MNLGCKYPYSNIIIIIRIGSRSRMGAVIKMGALTGMGALNGTGALIN